MTSAKPDKTDLLSAFSSTPKINPSTSSTSSIPTPLPPRTTRSKSDLQQSQRKLTYSGALSQDQNRRKQVFTPLYKSSSLNALQSSEEDCTEEDEPNTIIHVQTERLKTFMTRMLNDPGKDAQNQKKQFKKFTNTLSTIEQIWHKQQEEIARLTSEIKCRKEQLRDQKQLIDDLTQKIPTSETLAKAIEDQITTQIKQQVLDLTILPENQDNTATADSDNSLQEEPTIILNRQPATKSTSAPNRPIQSTVDPARRTAVVKHRENISGAQIMDQLRKISPTIGLIELVEPKRNSVHIICRTESKREILKRELQQNRLFNLNLNIIDLPLETYKIILSNVPEDLTEEYIQTTIKKTYKVPDTDFKLIFSYKHRFGGNNWIAVSPLDVAKRLVNSQGLCIGMHYVKINPHTSIPRCMNCKRLGHTKRVCTVLEHCNNCGEAHEITDTCTKPSRCTNCKFYNSQFQAKNPIDHASTSSTCPTYREMYAQQREKINTIFNIPERSNQIQPGNTFDHQQFPPLDQRMFPNFPFQMPFDHRRRQEEQLHGGGRGKYPYV